MRNGRVKAISVFGAAAICIAAATGARAGTNQPVYKLVPWAEISDRHHSELADLVREGAPANWFFAESAHHIVYAHSIRDADLAIMQAEFAWAEIGRLLEVAETGRKAHLILVSTDEIWEKLVRQAGLRPDGLAFQKGREIFVRSGNQVHVSRIPHELVHFRLRDTYGRLPLWLDEGLALQYGWRVAKLWADARQLKISRGMPPIPEDRRLTLDEVAGIRQYPENAFEAQAFYRQAEELTRAIADKIGLSRVGDFLKSVMDDKLPWRVALAEQFQFTDADFEALETAVREKSGEARND